MNEELRRDLKSIIYDLWDIRTTMIETEAAQKELHQLEMYLETIIENADYDAISHNLHKG